MSAKDAAFALARRWGLRDVAPADVRELAERGLVRVVLAGLLYDVDGFTAVEELRRVGTARRAWWKASINRWDAADLLGVTVAEFDALVLRHELHPGRSDRYSHADVVALRRGHGS